jgi:hypothetical protein
VNSKVDPTFSFMTLDHDGKIRMDCSSPYAMARLVSLKDASPPGDSLDFLSPWNSHYRSASGTFSTAMSR